MRLFADHPFWWWLDIETTGSDPARHSILEVAWVFTNPELERLDSGSWLVEPTETVDLKRLDNAVVRMHSANGLWLAWLAGPKEPLGYIQQVFYDQLTILGRPSGQRVLLCGSGAGRFDRGFLNAKQPGFCNGATYYDLDVSVLRRFFGLKHKSAHEKTHRALDDCHAAIKEFKFYQSYLEELRCLEVLEP